MGNIERVDIKDCASQRDAVVKHLKTYGNITQKQANDYYGASRLSAIIFNLRYKEGYAIETHMTVGKNRFGHTTEFAKYVLKED